MQLPDLSVVVTIVEGGSTLARCLDALSEQEGAASMEVIVPYDDTIPEVARLAARFPGYRFQALGSLGGEDLPRNAYGQHTLYDRRRAGGLRAARGRLVAMLEDRGWPRPDWARAMIDLHGDLPHAAIGGAIENASPGALRRAVFCCDFGRYQPPFQAGDAEYVSDINVCYKREALECVRAVWERRYLEVEVHRTLQRRGQRLHLSDRPRVVHRREPMGLWPMCLERVHWGRIFGELRARESSPRMNLARAAVAPLLPALLFLRQLRRQLRRRCDWPAFVAAIPATLTLLHFWCLGELVGSCTGMAASPRSTPAVDR